MHFGLGGSHNSKMNIVHCLSQLPPDDRTGLITMLKSGISVPHGVVILSHAVLLTDVTSLGTSVP